MNNKKPAIPELDTTRTTRAAACDFAILEAGTVSGATSVMLVLSDDEGSSRIFECSAQQFLTLASAVRGAVARFGK